MFIVELLVNYLNMVVNFKSFPNAVHWVSSSSILQFKDLSGINLKKYCRCTMLICNKVMLKFDNILAIIPHLSVDQECLLLSINDMFLNFGNIV